MGKCIVIVCMYPPCAHLISIKGEIGSNVYLAHIPLFQMLVAPYNIIHIIYIPLPYLTRVHSMLNLYNILHIVLLNIPFNTLIQKVAKEAATEKKQTKPYSVLKCHSVLM